MIYLFEGSDHHLIKQAIKKTLETLKLNPETIEYFDKKDSLNTVIQSAMTFSFFNEPKVIVYENASFFDTQENTSLLESYLANPNDKTVLIFVVFKLDQRKKIVQTVKQYVKHIVVQSLTDKTKRAYILEQLNMHNIKIDTEALQMFVEMMPLDSNIIDNEVIKLKLLQKPINKAIVMDYSSVYLDEDIFTFIDLIINNDISQILNYYTRFKNSVPFSQLIGLLASKLRLIYQVAVLANTKSESEIVKILNVKAYPVRLAYNYIYNHEPLVYLNLLTLLNRIWYKIRHGELSMDLGLEYFLFNREDI